MTASSSDRAKASRLRAKTTPEPARPVPTRAERSERSREAILEGAVTLFAQRGYDAVSLDDVARACGLNRSLILYYYKSKIGVWRATADDVIRRFNEAMEKKIESLPPAPDEETRLRQSVGAWIDGFVENPEYARLLVREGATPGPRLEWLLKRRGVPLLEKELLTGPRPLRRTMGRVTVHAVMYALAAMAPLLDSALALAAGGKKPAGVSPLSAKNREELIDILAMVVAYSRTK
jgi:AcrR family transcriptional regulator